jgi:RNA polymerase-interacting CarD/CdnL/TRCF family regulator
VPLNFAIRQRQQHNALPENLLTVAILLQHRQLVHEILRVDQQEEILMSQERQLLITIEERLDRELAQPQMSMLTEEAQRGDIATLIEQVKTQLHPGPNPYCSVKLHCTLFRLAWLPQFSDTIVLA